MWTRSMIVRSTNENSKDEAVKIFNQEARKALGVKGSRLRFTYVRPPKRIIVLYADNISGDAGKEDSPPEYGEMGLLYPKLLSLGTTPRMYAAAQKAVEEFYRVDLENLEFIGLAGKTAMQVWSCLRVGS